MSLLWIDDHRPCQDPGAAIATTYAEAVALLQEGDYDVVDVDYDLGDGPNGYDLLCWMAAHGRWPATVHIHSKHVPGVQQMSAFLDQWFPRSGYSTWRALEAQQEQQL